MDRLNDAIAEAYERGFVHGLNVQGEIVRCRDCRYLDDSEYERWDNSLAECYGEPPLFCSLLSINEWRMDGDRRVAETSFAEVEPNGFCAWGERRSDDR